MKSIADAKFDLQTNWFLAPPDHRNRLVNKCLRERLQRSPSGDPWVRDLFAFRQKFRSARRSAQRVQLRRQYYALSLARDIRRGKPIGLCHLLEAYLLTALKREAIAAKLGIPAAVVQWYRKLFFDIGPMRKYPLRIFHQVIGIADETGRTSLDHHKIWKLVGFVLGAKGLDEFFGVVQSGGVPEGGAPAWLALQTELFAKVQQLLAVGSLNPNNPQQIAALLKLAPVERAGGKGQENEPSTIFEQHIDAMIQALPFCVGTDGEILFKGTEIGKQDEKAAELRDEELWILGAGGTLPNQDDWSDVTIPHPTKRTPTLEFGTGTSPLEDLKPPK